MKRTLIFSIIAVTALIFSSCGNKQEISGNAPEFVYQDEDQVVNTVLDTAARYAAATNDDCKIVNGRRLPNPALLGVSNDTSEVTETIAIPGDTMNRKGWFYKDQLNTGSGDRDRKVVAAVTGSSSSGIPDWIKFLFWVVVGLLLAALAIWGIRHLLADNPSRTEERNYDNPTVIHHYGDIHHFHGDVHHHHEVVREEQPPAPTVQQNQAQENESLDRIIKLVNEFKNREGSISHTDANGANTEIVLGPRLPKEDTEAPDDEAK